MKKIVLLMALCMGLSSCSSGVKKYTVTFNSNGGSSVPSQTIEEGHKITKPDDPIRSGYTFKNWTYQDEEWSFIGWVVTEDLTLDANWDIVTYNISYDLDGGYLSWSNPYAYTVEDEITLHSPQRTGYDFAGWLLNNQIISKIEKGTTGDLNIKATWTIQKYSVSVVLNDSSRGSVLGGGEYDFGSSVSLTAVPYSGCVFKGWYNSNQTDLISKENPYTFTINSAISLYALFFTDQEEQDEWNKLHGIVPTLSYGGGGLTYGFYPQKHVNDESLITELNSINPSEASSLGYYYHDGEYYYKAVGNPCSNGKFEDGTSIVSGNTYWFLVQPVTWSVISKEESTYFVFASCALDAHLFDDDSSVYKDSAVRRWLESYMFTQMFGMCQDTNKINNTQIDEFSDKLFLLSKDEVSTVSSYSRTKRVTDFARNNGGNYSISQGLSSYGKGWYWTRTPINSKRVCYVDYDGYIVSGSTYYVTDSQVYNTSNTICVGMKITLS